MSLASAPLPSDPAALRALAAGLQAELARKELQIAANAAEIHAKTAHIEKLKMRLAVLRRARFGRFSEKLGSGRCRNGPAAELTSQAGLFQSDSSTRTRVVRVRPSGGRRWNTMLGSTCRWS